MDHLFSLHTYLLFMNASSSVSPKGAELGRFRKMRKKDTVWIRKPNSTIGSRPHRIVLDPRIPNKAPPVIKIIHSILCETIQILWDYRLPLWYSWGFHSFGMLHGVGYWQCCTVTPACIVLLFYCNYFIDLYCHLAIHTHVTQEFMSQRSRE
jgi:hypothetical protein